MRYLLFLIPIVFFLESQKDVQQIPCQNLGWELGPTRTIAVVNLDPVPIKPTLGICEEVHTPPKDKQ